MQKRKKKLSSLKKRQGRYGYLFTLPLMFGLVFLFLIPVGQTLVYSFNDIVLGATGIELEFSGLSNFHEVLFVDTHFRETVLRSVGDMLLNVGLIVIFSFFIATVLNQKFHGRAVARLIFFLPLVMASSALMNFDTGDILQRIMGSSSAFKTGDAVSGTFRSGNIAGVLIAGGIPDTFVDYLLQAADRIYEIVTLSGVQILIFLAALQSISPDLYEASDMEGATAWEKYWKITFPLVSPIIVLVIIYSIIDSFTMSDTIQLIQNKMFNDMRMGTAAAMSIIYFLLILVTVGIVYLLTRRLAYYSDK